jgi:hypothetical protein
MSKLHVIEFLQRIGNGEQAGASADAWILNAAALGLRFTKDELRGVIEQVIERPVDVDSCVEALLDASSELDLEMLEQVSGGVVPLANSTVYSASFVLRLATVRGSIGMDGGGDPTFCNSPEPPKGNETIY